MEKEIIVLGGIGHTDRRNRDDGRVLGRGGDCLCTEKPHIERQTISDKESKIIRLGEISNHQWGVVVSGRGILPTELAGQHKYPVIVVRKWEKSKKLE